MKSLVKRLTDNRQLTADEYRVLLTDDSAETLNLLRDNASSVARRQFGQGIFVRGLIEISSHCHNNCLYCGLRRDNRQAMRYRLTDDEILGCCDFGYRQGLRTFVLQGGEDPSLTDNRLVPLIAEIHRRWNDAAITLSLGERSDNSYRRLFQAGASRYLLRHEAADTDLYNQLHPREMSLDNRIDCIKNLISIGYQTGMGMMIGTPGQTTDHLIADLQLMQWLCPHMIGIGPFIPHRHTPYADHRPGDIYLTLKLIAIARLMHPDALIPATTALNTLSPDGHTAGILSGANVIMPNLSPASVRPKYDIYDNKKSSGTEAAECLNRLSAELATIGYHIDYSRGDHQSKATTIS
ncbi:MAG: [Muribaculaceae bacterium]|nr:[FeFe] hydrogenase H-cluster radical SAM maturase HydE [Muribaculaceae bacterium]